jgi:hypothetical protein
MPEHLLPAPLAQVPTSIADDDESEALNIRSRSPHPYHRKNSELLEPSDRLVYRAARTSSQASLSFTKESTPVSDSGTEADDEHFLKRLPAPKARLHKGLRGKNEPLSEPSTPLLSPALFADDGPETPHPSKRDASERVKRNVVEKARRRKELLRRLTEFALQACLAGFVQANRDVKPFLRLWQRGDFPFLLLFL